MAEEKKKFRSDEELELIAVDLFKSLKPMELTVREIKDVIQHMDNLVNCIIYGG